MKREMGLLTINKEGLKIYRGRKNNGWRKAKNRKKSQVVQEKKNSKVSVQKGKER